MNVIVLPSNHLIVQESRLSYNIDYQIIIRHISKDTLANFKNQSFLMTYTEHPHQKKEKAMNGQLKV